MARDASLNVPYLIITGVAIGAALVVFGVLRPQLNAINSVQDNIAAQTAKSQEREEFLRTIDRRISELSKQKVHEERLAVMLPDSERTEDTVRVLHRAAESSGVVVTTLTNSSNNAQAKSNTAQARGEKSTIPKNVTLLSFSVEFSGSYQQFRAFLTELERSPRLMDITSVQLQGISSAPGDLTGQIVAVFYAQKFSSSETNL